MTYYCVTHIKKATERNHRKLQPLVIRLCFIASCVSVFAGKELCNQTRVIIRNFDACVSTVT